MNVSRLMSTQHPDNVRPPFFADNNILGGEDEIKEAFYAFSHLGCGEQLWDCEGKEVDSHVVKKLLSRYEHFFRQKKLGRDVFLTLRVPNPDKERSEAKILLETPESIPRCYDLSKLFYGEDIPPIFEVSVPMISSSRMLIRIAEYYKQIVVGKKKLSLLKGDVKISDWIGDFQPEQIRMIPLCEDKEGILASAKITEEYMASQKVTEYQRVWIARSDPALNYGSLAAVILAKIAIQRLADLERKTSVKILPILGCGSNPFRGNFSPPTVDQCLREFPSVHTFTAQSAFKYDYPENEILKAIEQVNTTRTGRPNAVDEPRLLELFDKVSATYESEISLIYHLVNDFSKFIPERRKRKLHIGLFGYSRSVKGIALPRTIPFCASLYSLGLPPEMLGLDALTEKDWDYISKFYPTFELELCRAMQYFNPETMKIFPAEIAKRAKKVAKRFKCEANQKHNGITSIISENFARQNHSGLHEQILMAGGLRGYLG